MDRTAPFAEVVLPAAVEGTFTYRIPNELASIVPGVRVVVPFGRGRKLHAAVVRRLVHEPPPGRQVREVLSVLDEHPVVTQDQLAFWERVANHYLCTLGEVMLAALPPQLQLSSTTRIVATDTTPSAVVDDRRLTLLLDALERERSLSLAEAGDLLGVKDPIRLAKVLIDSGALGLEERLAAGYRPRQVRHVVLVATERSEDRIRHWFAELERAPKQLALLMRFIERSHWVPGQPAETPMTGLLSSSDAGRTALAALVKKGLFTIEERPDSPPPVTRPMAEVPALSTAQQQALSELQAAMEQHGTTLLQGVTSSGKTELYVHLIDAAIRSNGQVLYLLPEIALTSQLIARLQARFGDRVAVFHSRLTARQRTELWMALIEHPDRHPVVIGARSALFLPFRKLSLVIVDEEHDPSFKQQDPAPRYHARDMAIVLGGQHDAHVLLGSATPSLESRYNADQGKYGSVRLTERYGASVLPGIVTIDLRRAHKERRMRGHFTPELLGSIGATVAERQQVILFQNRRGYAPIWQCEQCGHIPECVHCDVSLTYHKRDHVLRCHYCGRSYPPPAFCPECGSARLKMIGLGTERIEEELALHFPEARIARLDQDTARGRHGLERILGAFAEGAIDVLVGTQMVTKGLDFERVSLVGILNADRLLNFPDFRAHERGFQLMAQVAGRSGRRGRMGQVMIQAFDVAHPVIGFVLGHDVDGFLEHELEHRRVHNYPPFTRLVRFTLKHRNEERVAAAAAALMARLHPDFGDRALGPEVPSVAWVRDQHIRNVLVKLRRSDHASEKHMVDEAFRALKASPVHGAVRLIVDVDPV
ncbi:MAG: primosomal protein N' [Flavobacteriales bacterium]|nr:primosomal protein N' [Flavobacteriales bacterium]